jgi:hypothetical protein
MAYHKKKQAKILLKTKKQLCLRLILDFKDTKYDTGFFKKYSC